MKAEVPSLLIKENEKIPLTNTMQFKYSIECSLRSYYLKVRKKEWDFSFEDRCLICGGEGCAVFHGFYFRKMVLENWELVEDFPVARFLCRGKGKKKRDAVTFSLLPSAAVPYRLLSLPVLMDLMLHWKVLKHTVEQTLDYVMRENSKVCVQKALLLSEKALSGVQQLFNDAFERLSISRQLSTLVSDLSGMEREERTVFFLERIKDYMGVTTEEEGIVALDWDYYSFQKGFFMNAHFLFGTASQFRSP